MLSALDLMIGLVFFFLLMSLLCMITNELIAQFLRFRSKTLFAEINRILDDKAVQDRFWKSGLIRSYCRPCADLSASDAPEYLNAGIFASAVIRAINGEDGKPLSASISKDSILKDVITELETTADATIADIEAGLSTWFETIMTRAEALYRKNLQIVSLAVALIIAAAANADTFAVAKALWVDAGLRAQVVSAASDYIEENAAALTSAGETADQDAADQTPAEAFAAFEAGLAEINDGLRSFPIGWDADSVPKGWLDGAATALGLFVTALAMTLGAPFWFDLLRSLFRLRPGRGGGEDSAGNPFSRRARENGSDTVEGGNGGKVAA
ncbi:MAG: hypothetical protein AAF318_12460 [Pseudomonadota bacterium]